MILLRVVTFFFILTTSTYAKGNEVEKIIQKKWIGWVGQTLDFASNKVGKPFTNCTNNSSDIANFPLIDNSQDKIKKIENFLGNNESFEKEFRAMTASLHFKHINNLLSANFKKMSVVKMEKLNNKDLSKFKEQGINQKNMRKVHIRVWNTETSKIIGKILPLTDSDEIRDITLYIGKKNPAVPDGIWAINSHYKAWKKDSNGSTPVTRNIFTAHPALFRKQKNKPSP